MPGPFQVSRLKFKAGTNPGSAPLEVATEDVILLVGPNGSGKSLTLKDLEAWCQGNTFQSIILESVIASLPGTAKEAQELLMENSYPARGAGLPEGTLVIGVPRTHGHGGNQALESVVRPEEFMKLTTDQDFSRSHVIRVLSARLDGEQRFALTQQLPHGVYPSRANNHIWALFDDDLARKQWQLKVKDAFGFYPVINHLQGGHYSISTIERDDAPPWPDFPEKSLENDARSKMASLGSILERGDGARSFVGLLAVAMAGKYRILIIDEPEAFLHPPQARRMGTFLTQVMAQRAGSLVVATHSSDFLMGVTTASRKVTIVRLTFTGGKGTARALSTSELEDMMYDPLVRSTKAMDSLFHEGTVVAESDADRAFYDEVNRRLVEVGKGMPDCLFLNAYNRQTIHKIVGPLRHIGVAVVAVPDLDVLRGDDHEWDSLLEAAHVEVAARAGLKAGRDVVRAMFPTPTRLAGARPPDPLKDQGLSYLQDPAKSKAHAFLDQLAEYGIFPVPCGELEGWLRQLHVAGHGPGWLEETLIKMGRVASDGGYVKPDGTDVWAWMQKIAQWMGNPNRKGM